MRSRFKDYIQDSKKPPSKNTLSESIVGKGLSLIQTRNHATNKGKLHSVLSRIQNNAKKGIAEEDVNERFELLFTLFFDLAAAIKIESEMSTNSINVSAIGVLDSESIKKELEKAFPKKFRP